MECSRKKKKIPNRKLNVIETPVWSHRRKKVPSLNNNANTRPLADATCVTDTEVGRTESIHEVNIDLYHRILFQLSRVAEKTRKKMNILFIYLFEKNGTVSCVVSTAAAQLLREFNSLGWGVIRVLMGNICHAIHVRSRSFGNAKFYLGGKRGTSKMHVLLKLYRVVLYYCNLYM